MLNELDVEWKTYRNLWLNWNCFKNKNQSHLRNCYLNLWTITTFTLQYKIEPIKNKNEYQNQLTTTKLNHGRKWTAKSNDSNRFLGELYLHCNYTGVCTKNRLYCGHRIFFSHFFFLIGYWYCSLKYEYTISDTILVHSELAQYNPSHSFNTIGKTFFSWFIQIKTQSIWNS